MENCKEKKIEEYVRSIPDFPEEGVIFRDVTSILQDADGFALAVDSMQKLLEDSKVDVIVGTESRGFIFGAPIAYNLHKPLVLVRKKGKLRPPPVPYSTTKGSDRVYWMKPILQTTGRNCPPSTSWQS